MDYTHKKLPKEAVNDLWRFPTSTLKPFRLTVAPVYLYLIKNQKFISIRGPLDFFTEADLEKVKSFEHYYLPKFVDLTEPFRNAGSSVRRILSWKADPRTAAASEGEHESYPAVKLDPAPYELSDAVLRVVGPLWGKGGAIEGFFVSVFVDALCDPLPSEILLAARETGMDRFERATMLSSWVVFLAIHLGHCHLHFLNQLRYTTFIESAAGTTPSVNGSEIDELVAVASETLVNTRAQRFEATYLLDRLGRVSHKMAARLERVKEEFIKPARPIPSVFGKGGLIDV